MKMTDFYEDACYLSDSEPEADSDDDSGAPIVAAAAAAAAAAADASAQPDASASWDDPANLLNTWLGELDHLKEVRFHYFLIINK